MRVPLVFSLLFTGLVLMSGAWAESFKLAPGTAIYGCDSFESAKYLVTNGTEDYQKRVCPKQGPFNNDVLYGEVVHSESLDDPTHPRSAVVKWSISSTSRTFYSILIQSSGGL